MAVAGRDSNFVPTLTALSSANDGAIVPLWADPTTHRLLVDNAATATITVGTTAVSGGTNGRVLYDNNGTLGEYPITGTAGSVVMSNSPTLVTPALGTPSALVLTNATGTPTSIGLANGTGLPISTGVSGLGTGVATALGINVGTAGAFVTNGGALGTPASGVATNLTGTAAGLTAGTVTTNANLTGVITSVGNATSIASQTGTGSKFVVDTSPTLVTPNIGVATATTINKVTITAPATGSTLTIADGKTLTITNSLTVNTNDGTLAFGAASKTLTVNKSLTLDGTDGTTMTFPSTSATIARTDAANTFTGVQTFNTPIASSSVATMTSTVGGGVPTPPNNTTTFLRGDGTFATPSTSLAYASGVATRDLSTASGNQTIAHGLGVTPKYVRVTAYPNYTSVSSSANGFSSTGSYNGTTGHGIYTYFTLSSGAITAMNADDNNNKGASGSVLVIISNGGTSLFNYATMTVDSTNITLAWTKTSTPTGTAFIFWEAQG
jgi:hypothetical protein